MKTKEQYIDECIPLAEDDYIELPNGLDIGFIKRELLPRAMGEYAKESVLEFNDWLFKNKWVPNNSYLWFKADATREMVRFYELHKLYTAFLTGNEPVPPPPLPLNTQTK